jgi:hypothetical protein
MKIQYMILYLILCYTLFVSLIKWGAYLYDKHFVLCSKEGFVNSNTPEYSHSVDMPINNIYSCKNFCGPKAQCAITRSQCTSDIDCSGCMPPNNPNKPEVSSYEDSGKLSSNQGLHYSSLTNGYGLTFAPVDKNTQDDDMMRPYEGLDMWTHSFNAGLKIYNNKRTYGHSPSEEQNVELPIYPTTVSATGLFYNTGPSPSNADI